MFQHVSTTAQVWPLGCWWLRPSVGGLHVLHRISTGEADHVIPWPHMWSIDTTLTDLKPRSERKATDEDLRALEVQPHKHWRCIPAVLYWCGVASDRWGLQPSVVAKCCYLWVSSELSSLGIELVPFPSSSILFHPFPSFPILFRNVTLYALWMTLIWRQASTEQVLITF